MIQFLYVTPLAQLFLVYVSPGFLFPVFIAILGSRLFFVSTTAQRIRVCSLVGRGGGINLRRSRFARGTELIRNPSESVLETSSFLSRLNFYFKCNRILSGCFLHLLAHYGLNKFSVEIHQNLLWKHPPDDELLAFICFEVKQIQT